MLFNSYIFILVFLPIFLAMWWGLGKVPRLRMGMLVVASYVFYGWWDWRFTSLLMISTVLDYQVGAGLARRQSIVSRRLLLGISLAGNLGLLAYFKYSGFMAQSINEVLAFLRTGGAIPVPEIILPVGISFYTFQTMTYSIDLYRGVVKPARSFLDFAAYVSMFPQLIAGPIVRYSDVEEQFGTLIPGVDWEKVSRGIWFFVIGMGQKVLIADTAARLGVPLLENPEQLQLASGWLALLSYTCQLYFDFAGYSNMAVGLGLMIGFQFPQNFDSPYQSVNIQDFWRRWHMTLSSFLRDYLYVPLGGSRSGLGLTTRNLIFVMLLGGIWHGAGWTFALWGLYHGLLLVAHLFWKERIGKNPDRTWLFPRLPSIALTFLCVMLGWLLFRSTDLDMAGQWLSALVGGMGIERDFGRSLILSAGGLATLGGLGICFLLPNIWRIQRPMRPWSAFLLAGVLFVCVLRFHADSPFLYFQF